MSDHPSLVPMYRLSPLDPVFGCLNHFEPDGTRVCTDPASGLTRRDPPVFDRNAK
jgi:hypothetical protein